MNCRPGQLAMVVKPIGVDPPNYLLGRVFRVLSIDPQFFDQPCWRFDGPPPVGRLRTGYEFCQVALPDANLMPIDPTAAPLDVPREASLPVLHDVVVTR